MPFSGFFQFIDKVAAGRDESEAKHGQANSLEAHASTIQSVFSELQLGEKPDESAKERITWKKKHGSAALLTSIYKDEKNGDLHVEIIAPLVKFTKDNLTPNQDTVTLLHLLLDLNYHLSDVRLAISEQLGVVMVARRRALGLDKAEFLHMLKTISINADRIDNLLARDFKLKMWGSENEIAF